MILDEAQRAPGLFLSLKAAVDRDRKPGRFVLTGSANVLLAPKLSDSLAGRIEILRLHPLAKCEVESNPGDFIAVTLSRDGGLLGQLLETFVYQELRRQASWSEQRIRYYHLRDRDGYEVDMVLERQGRDIVGVEVKSAATVTARDFRAMRRLKSALGDRFCAGVVLYDGERAVRFEEKLFAVPIAALWGRA